MIVTGMKLEPNDYYSRKLELLARISSSLRSPPADGRDAAGVARLHGGRCRHRTRTVGIEVAIPLQIGGLAYHMGQLLIVSKEVRSTGDFLTSLPFLTSIRTCSLYSA